MRPGAALLLLGAAALATAGACARAQPPPGGPVPETPPPVIGTTPEPHSIVEGFRDAAVIRFGERLSERGLDDAVLVSPETGTVRVKRGRRELRVSVEGGWLPDEVYRVEVRPGVRDLFGNERTEPFELIFSTGAPIPSTAVAGIVTDRITGRPARGARVEAIRQPDSVRYVAITDTAGIFTIRHIPRGEYEIVAYEDRNGNRRPDPFEPVERTVAAVADADTVLLAFALLVPDTTPARVVRAEAPDSSHVVVSLDDHLDPFVPLDDGEVSLIALEDSAEVAVEALLHVHQYEARQRAAAAAARDTVEAGRTDEPDAVPAADRPATEPPDAAPPPEPDDGPDTPPDDTEPLPTRDLVVVPAAALAPGARYRVEVRGITNISDIPGGGGSAEFRVPERPPEPEPEPPADDPPPDDAPPPDDLPPDDPPPDDPAPDDPPPDDPPPDDPAPDDPPPDDPPPDDPPPARPGR